MWLLFFSKQMKHLVTIFAALLCLACNNHEEQLPQTAVPDDSTPLFIEVTEITATSACVTITPKDSQLLYYFDTLRADYFKVYNEVYGFQCFIDGTLNTLMNTHSLSKEEILETFLFSGTTNRQFTTLTPQSDYYAIAMGIDPSGTITTTVIALPFSTTE